MDIVLIENSQHKVERDQRRQDQVGLRGEGGLKYLRRALKPSVNRSRKDHRAYHILNRDDRVSERDIRGKVKGKGYRRKLSLVGNCQRRHRGLIVRECAERNFVTTASRADIDILERIGTLLELLSHFHHDMVLVNSLIHGGDLPLAKGVVQRVIDYLRGHA